MKVKVLPGRGLPIVRSLLLVMAIIFCDISLYLCHRALLVMERAVTVMEKVDAKLDRAIAAAPSATERGKELISSPEADRLREITKERAATLGTKARGWIDSK